MQQPLHKSLALLLSASLLCAYVAPGYALETISGEKILTEADVATTSNQTDGAYYVTNTGTLKVMSDASFANNSSSIDDGAAINNAGTLTVDGASFNNNTVNYTGGAGGALFLKGTNTINDATFDSNSVVGDYGGGALYLSKNAQSLTLTNSSFTNNTATNATSAEDAAGGAVALLKKAKLEKVTFTGNKTVSSGNIGNGGGGAMFIGAEGKVEIEDSSFNSNTSATDGGAIATRSEPPASNVDATLDIEETSFTGNIASGKGGAIYNSFYNSVETPGYVSIDDSTFTGNAATSGGAIFNDHSGKINVEESTFDSNTATAFGGALFLRGTSIVKESKFSNNSVSGDGAAGGAILLATPSANNKPSLVLEDVIFENNTANTTTSDAAAGGAVALYGTASVNKSTFTGNKTTGASKVITGGGGAMFIGAVGKVNVTESSFSQNSSATDGGAIATRDESTPADNKDAVLDITNSHFDKNQATRDGGAFYNNFYNSTNKAGSAYVANATFTNNEAGRYGGAIHNKGSLEVISSTFDGNTAQVSGGAIASTTSSNTKVDGSSFTNNHAKYDGGAIGNFNGLTITNSTFENNTAQMAQASDGSWTVAVTDDSAPIGGGAIALGAVSATQVASVSNTSFKGNKSGRNGGAIGTRLGNNKNDNQSATLDIQATFENNEAYEDGGAIYNTFYTDNGLGKGEGVTVMGSFTGNYAHQNGGAIYNSADTDKNGKAAIMTITDTTFTNNKADVNGGAIYNASILTLSGNNTFTGNTAGGAANDIHNIGTLNIGGTALFEGGITGTGIINVANGATVDLGLSSMEADAIAFANGSTLGITLSSDSMGNLKANTITIGESTNDAAKLLVTVSTDFATEKEVSQELTNGTVVTNGTFSMSDVTNALYDVSFDNNTNVITAVRKSQEEQTAAIESAGGNTNNLSVITAFTSSSDLGSDASNQMAQTINQLAQTDVQAAVQATTALAPQQAAAKQAVQNSAVNQLFSAINSRLNNAANGSVRTYAFGDSYFADGTNYSVWAQGLLNKSHKESTSDASSFSGRSTGLAFGADTQVAEDWTVGLGYAYLHTNVSSLNRHDRVLGDNFFLYGQYRPSNFFVQAALNYGDSKYEEEKDVAGNEVNADYHLKSYSANLTAGYELSEEIIPLFGLRYTNTQQAGYKDSVDQYVSSEKDDYLTAILGVQVQQESMFDDIKIRPALNLGLAYDLLSDNVSSRVSLPNGTAYDVNGERLHRLSFEAGLSVAALVSDNVEVVLSYDGSFRQDYNSNTGSLKLRYMF